MKKVEKCILAKLIFVVSVFLMINDTKICAALPADVSGIENEMNKTLSPYFVVISKNSETDRLPLKSTEANVKITGVIADVTINQTYINAGKNTLEAVYTFPMSTKAAVYAMKMKIGSRTITAEIYEKEKARKEYEKAKEEGNRASLLEQNRPNVFTMNVANIAVNDTIIVELKYTELLIPENGNYSFVYPTVVGPRYTTKTDRPGNENETFTNTPYTHETEMPAYDLKFNLFISPGIPIQYINCPSHKIQTTYPDAYSAKVSLDASESKGGNRDIIINYSMQGNTIQSGLMLFENADENYFLMMIQPPKKIQMDEIPDREYIFIVDVSGSMSGFPLKISKKLMKNLLENLKPTDKFNIILFSGSTGLFRQESVNANTENISGAIHFIESQRGGGGTELLPALKKAYQLKRSSDECSRSFVLLSDGYVSVESEAFELIRKQNSNSNFFCFGIGSSVNRYLMEGLAFMGNGEPVIADKEDGAEIQAEKFRQYINTPVLTQIKANFGEAKVYDVEPFAIPDLLAERPLVIFGKYKGKAQGKVTITGISGHEMFEKTMDFAESKPDPSNSAIRYLWAREQIKLLDYNDSESRFSEDGTKDSIKKQITELGLKYNLMTKYTSFLAVDRQFKIDNDIKKCTVKQVLPLPKGVSNQAISEEVRVYSPNPVHTGIICEEDENVVFQVVETMPGFVGGENALREFLSKNIKYPALAKMNNIQGIVIVQFDVDKDGSIVNISVIRSVSPELDKEAIRVVRMMPKWNPGKQRGKPVKTKFTLPINFRLSQDS